jgi:hypothetical protein
MILSSVSSLNGLGWLPLARQDKSLALAGGQPMPSFKFRCGLLGAVLIAFPLWAIADEAKLPELSPDGKDVCYGRVYDAQHLQAHPNQKIQRIFFLYGHDPIDRPNEEPPPHQSSSYTVFLATTTRDEKKPKWTGAWCHGDASDDASAKTGRVSCQMECEKSLGHFKRNEKGDLIFSGLREDLYLDPDAEDTLGKAEYKRQAFGADDDNFALAPQPLDVCKAEFGRIDPPNPALGPPLRERLKPDQPFCYGRDYDADHLKGHPKQATVSIRLYRNPAEIADYAALPESERRWADNAKIQVAVTTRGASKSLTQRYYCNGEADQWKCLASSDACSLDSNALEIDLRRDINNGMILANPKSALPVADLCESDVKGPTKSDDKIFRLNPMPLSACGM